MKQLHLGVEVSLEIRLPRLISRGPIEARRSDWGLRFPAALGSITRLHHHHSAVSFREGRPEDGGGLTGSFFIAAQIHDQDLIFLQIHRLA